MRYKQSGQAKDDSISICLYADCLLGIELFLGRKGAVSTDKDPLVGEANYSAGIDQAQKYEVEARMEPVLFPRSPVPTLSSAPISTRSSSAAHRAHDALFHPTLLPCRLQQYCRPNETVSLMNRILVSISETRSRFRWRRHYLAP